MTGMLAVLFTLQAAVQDPFLVRVDLQALYDQISGMTLSFEQPADVDVLQAVLYTSDYTLVDENGRHWSRIELRDESIRVFQQSPVDWMAQAIRKVSLTADGARALVDIDSTTGREGEAGRWLSGYLRHIGYAVTEQLVDANRFNIIADQVTLEGTIRTLDAAVRREMKERIQRTVTGVATTHGLTAALRWVGEGNTPTMNDAAATERATDAKMPSSSMLNRRCATESA